MLKQRLLVDLDSLLDTRIGTLAQMDLNYALRLAEVDYLGRESDDFEALLGEPGLNERFKEAYEKRDVETLKLSQCTGMVYALNDITQAWEGLLINTPHVEDITIDINTYPYRLSDEEKEAFCKAILAYSSLTTKVDTVYVPTEDLTPKLIMDRWTLLAMYDFNAWLEVQIENLKETKIPGVGFITPALYRNKVPGAEDLSGMDELKGLSPFAALEMIMAEYLHLANTDVRFFSLLPPPKTA